MRQKLEISCQEFSKHFCHLWSPDLAECKGGIQVYSSFLFQALQNLYPKVNYQVFIKNDIKLPQSYSHLPATKFHLTGNFPSSIRTSIFIIQLLSWGILQNPDLIISTHPNFIPVAHQLYRILRIPYWTIAHGIEAWNIENPILQSALRDAELILAVSKYTRDRLLKEQNLDPQKVSVLHNTFDASKFQPAPKPTYLLDRYQLQSDQLIILTVGRLSASEQYKGYDKVLKAMPKIRSIISNIHYIIAGKGNDKLRIQKLITELNLEESVTLAGFVPDSELCDHYNLCDLFAMPSKGEGFGIVYLEAMACGKPVVAGNKDGAIDALCNGDLGALVNPDDIDEIAQTIIQILRNQYPNPIIYQPEVLRQKVIEIFGFENFQHTLSKHLDFYLT